MLTFSGWLAAFVATQVVEVPIYTWALKGRVHLAFFASLVTHPIVYWAFPWRGALPYVVVLVGAELFAVLAEAYFLWRVAELRRALLWSCAANAASVAVGYVSRALWGWP